MEISTQWPADRVERRKTSELVPDARNARTHSDAQIEQLARSIKEWGWTTPVLVDDAGGIIAGHGRVLAALSLGLDEVPTMTASGWTAEQRRAYVLADNKLALNAGWDSELLRLELAELDENFDLSLLGWNDDELVAILTPGQALDEMPHLSDADRSEFGEMSFILHRSQIDTVQSAITAAIEEMDRDGPNRNKNGSALAHIAERFLGAAE